MTLLELTSIHGLNYTTDANRPLCDRIFWAFIVLFGVIGTVYIVQTAFNNWSEQPILTTIDTVSQSIKEIQFPTTTICSDLRMDSWGSIRDLLNEKTAALSEEGTSYWKQKFDFIRTGLFDYVKKNIHDVFPKHESFTFQLACICLNKYIGDVNLFEEVRGSMRTHFLHQEIFFKSLKLEDFDPLSGYQCHPSVQVRDMHMNCYELVSIAFVNILYINSGENVDMKFGDIVANLAPLAVGQSSDEFPEKFSDDQSFIKHLFNFSESDMELHTLMHSLLDEIFVGYGPMNMSLLEIPAIFEESLYSPITIHKKNDDSLKYPYSLFNHNDTASLLNNWPINYFGHILTGMKKEVIMILLSSMVGNADDITPFLSDGALGSKKHHPRNMLKMYYKGRECLPG